LNWWTYIVRKYCLSVPVFHFWPLLTHPAARSLCDSWATCSYYSGVRIVYTEPTSSPGARELYSRKRPGPKSEFRNSVILRSGLRGQEIEDEEPSTAKDNISENIFAPTCTFPSYLSYTIFLIWFICSIFLAPFTYIGYHSCVMLLSS